ncbi:MAG TPA: alpha-1,4-glucan--maltose-1-phosphate maltosyltransferase [Kofleriaceae bacterium]|nr:alpha-1,4-glucan--maltose-1-phosphate maltosyltransferase [Kofleriaceae bacterium]
MPAADVHDKHHSEDPPPRVVILAVRPEVDGGRYPAKRVVGDTVDVEVDLTSDGHDVVRAMLLHRPPGDAVWHEVELRAVGNDTWRASFVATALGRHHYTVTGWVDAFATWRHGLERKVQVGTDVSVELLEGALLVDAAALRAERSGLGTAAMLRDLAGVLRSAEPMESRIATALSATLADTMARAPDRTHAARYRHELELHVERPLAATSSWYELFPRSTGDGRHGTFRDAERWLEYVADLGFDILYLPPIHPIGLAFRKGPDNSPTSGPEDVGSPWAIGAAEGGHTSVHPQLGTLDDFDHFFAAARSRGLDVALDIAFQCSPDHPWVREHPQWFKQRPDGTIQYAENPPKKYQDVYPFDFECADWRNLWAALRDVFLFWCDRGVRVFRVDNPHTKPIPFWEWCLREVQARVPETVFLSEAFTRPKLMYALAKSGFSQGYTYFTWRTTKWELENYLTELVHSPVADFYRPNFWPTTPDIFPEHLVYGGHAIFTQRLILAATLGANYGIYGPSFELMENVQRAGVEELARNEKYQLRSWDIMRPSSLRHVIARLNRIRRAHPALHDLRSLHFHRTDNELVMAYSKRRGDSIVLVVVNLDAHHTHRAWLDLDLAALGVQPEQTFQVHDLLSGARYSWRGPRNFVELVPDEMPAHIFEVRRFARSENQFEYFL